MIIEVNVRYVSPCGTTSAVLECDTLDTEGEELEAVVEDRVNDWFFEMIEDEFSTYYREYCGMNELQTEYEIALERYIEDTDLFIDEF